MSLTRVLNNVASAFCMHEWARRRDGGHVFLECVHCLATTPGIDLTPIGRRSRPVLQRTLRPVKA